MALDWLSPGSFRLPQKSATVRRSPRRDRVPTPDRLKGPRSPTPSPRPTERRDMRTTFLSYAPFSMKRAPFVHATVSHRRSCGCRLQRGFRPQNSATGLPPTTKRALGRDINAVANGYCPDLDQLSDLDSVAIGMTGRNRRIAQPPAGHRVGSAAGPSARRSSAGQTARTPRRRCERRLA